MWHRLCVLPAAVLVALAASSACGSAQPAQLQGTSSTVGAGAATTAPTSVVEPAGASTPGRHLTESNPPGDIPDKQVFVAYSPPGTHFSVSVPEGWARTITGGSVTFTDKLNSITMQESAATSPSSPPTVAASLLPDLSRQVPQFTAGKVTTVTRTAGAAVLLTYAGDSAPDPVTNKVVRNAFERYAFWSAGHEVVLTLVGPVDADNVDPWKTVTDSLRWR
jgi:hypothetical protein